MAELKEKYGPSKVDVELVVGGGGIFDVELDGKRVFCKKDVGRFPTLGEIPLAIDTIMINK